MIINCEVGELRRNGDYEKNNNASDSVAMTSSMAFRGEFELRHRTSADSLNFGGVRIPDDQLSRRRLQEDLQEDEDEDDDAPPDYELDENGSIASLESIEPDKGNKIRFVIIAVLSCICGISFTLFLFLVPFQACGISVHLMILFLDEYIE